MVEYTTSLSNAEMGLDHRRVVLVEKKSSSGRMWKLIGALFFLALCFAGVLLFVWYLNGRPEGLPRSGQIEALINRDSSVITDPQSTLSRISSEAKAAIHLEGHYNEDDNKLEWMSDQGQAFSQGDLKLMNNKIMIPKSGLYFVYSKASFHVVCGNTDRAGNGLTPLSHRIWRYSDSMGKRASLMSGVRSVCQGTSADSNITDDQGWYNTIYLGAVFELNRGDELWTETNQLSELETQEGMTFFGVFAL